MKILFASLLLFLTGSSFAQTLSVQPDSVNLGQNLTILFSGTNLNFSQGTNTSWIYFEQGSSTIYPNQTYAYDATHMAADFSIPTYANCGSYTALVFGQGSNTLSFPNSLFIDCSTNISGKVYNDQNNNGVNNGEPGFPYSIINVQPGNIVAYTDYLGNYSLPLAAGTYQVSVVPPTYYSVSSSPATYSANTSVTPIITGLDFGLYAPPVNDLGVYIFGPHPRVGYSRPYWVAVANNGTTDQTPVITLTLDSNLSISYCDYPYTASGNTYTITPGSTISAWNYLGFEVDLTAGASVPLNQNALIVAQIANALQPDQNPADNVDSFWTYFVNSFDPNEKSVSPAGVGTDNQTLKSATLQYQIGFQNTGNDVAYLVRIMDTLDANLDLSTFKLLGSSSPCTYTLKERTVTFTFTGINLPASSVDPIKSNGYVSYSIKPKPGIAENTIIANTASIYFDFNPAVVTNTTTSKMVTTISGINDLNLENAFLVYPNPTSDIITISNEKYNMQSIAMYDMLGALVMSTDVHGYSTRINTSNLTAGVYLLRVNTVNGSFVKRVSVMH